MAFNQTEYITEWERKNCEQVKFRVPKGKKALLKETAKRHNTNVTRLFVDAVEEKYKIDITSRE